MPMRDPDLGRLDGLADDALIGRLRRAGEVGDDAAGVDVAAVAAQVRRRRDRRRAVLGVSAAVVLAVPVGTAIINARREDSTLSTQAQASATAGGSVAGSFDKGTAERGPSAPLAPSLPVPADVVAGDDGAPGRSTRCPPGPPGDDGRSVPAPPRVAGAAESLVPQQVPDAVTICRYAGTDVQRIVLTGSLTGVPRDLARLPVTTAIPACRPNPTVPRYLVELAYPGGGTVWLVAGGDCPGTGNGLVVTPQSLADLFDTAARTGVWPDR